MSRSREKTDTVNQTLQSAVSDSKDKVNSLGKVADEVTKSRETVDKYVSDAKKMWKKSIISVLKDWILIGKKWWKKIENMKCQDNDPLKKVTEEVTDWMTAIKNTQEVTKKHITCETSME